MADVGTEAESGTPQISKRVKERKRYTDDCLQDEEIEGRRMFSVEEKLSSDRFGFHFVHQMKGEDFDLKFLQKNGFVTPILFSDKTGLGMRMPSSNFTVNDVRQCVGSRRMLDVMDVTTQKDIEMTMKDWCRYFENENRDKLLNVISLEFSHTRLENYVESPTVVRQVDWVDWVWPRHLKESQTDGTNSLEEMKYPKVQKYCLMSVKGCYTDFHIDFGGTSVWYHILRGKKVFWLIPPTERNICLYEQWVLSGKQGDVFFGDTVEKCARVHLQSGDTFFIPTGWIHAVYTPEDTLVFGGNFLHNFGIEKQLRIAEVEDLTHVPVKFRYPFYTEVLWYVAQRFVQCLLGKNHLTCNEDGEPVDEEEEETKSSPSEAVDLSAANGQPSNMSSSVQMNGEQQLPPSSMTECLPVAQNDCIQSPLNGIKPIYANGDINREPLKSVSFSQNCETNSASEIASQKRPHVHMTKYEYDGLKAILRWLQTLPPSKRNVPDLIRDPDRLLEDVKIVLEEHKEDIPELAVTGKPVFFWSEPKKLKPKPRAGLPPSSSKNPKAGSSKNANNARRRRTRCKKCEACLRADCGDCHFCKDMKKFGGPGRMKQSCISRQCMAPVLPHTACCMICGRDGWDKLTNPPENENSSLMECSQCWEILHPKCLQEKYPELSMEGCLNDDLPNSWECPKCCRDGKPDQVKPRQMKGKSVKTTEICRPSVSAVDLSCSEEARLGSAAYMSYDVSQIKAEIPQPNSESEDMKHMLDSEPLDLGPEKKKIKSEPSEIAKSEHVTSTYVGPGIPENELDVGSASYSSIPDSLNADNTSASSDREEENASIHMSSSPKENSPDDRKDKSISHVRSCARYPMTWKKTLKNGHEKILTVKNSNEKIDHRSQSRLAPGVALRRQGTARERLFRSLKGLKKNTEVIRMKTTGIGKFDDSVSYRTFTKGLKVVKLNEINSYSSSTKNGMPPSAMENHRNGVLVSGDNVLRCENNSNGLPPSQNQKISSILRNSPNLKKPKYVVRPASIVDDSSEEKRKNSHAGVDNLALEKEVILPVFQFLPARDLYTCQFVCKTWNRWSVDPRLWTTMDMTRRKITPDMLIGIVRRQPVVLNLSWTNLSRRQLAWLIARLPQMKELALAGCSSASVGALCTCNCPLLRTLDLSWVEGLTDSVIRDLLAPPPDSRPGFVENKTRLRHLTEVKLAGADISDVSVRLLAHHLPLLAKLDLSHCNKVTDMGIAVLGAAKCTRLTSLDVSACSNITDTSLDALKRCTNLTYLDLRDCNQVTEAACAKFVGQYRQTLMLKDGKLIQKNQ